MDNLDKDKAAVWKVVQKVAKELQDNELPRLEHYPNWTFFRLCMGWDRLGNVGRFRAYLSALRSEFPEAVLDIRYGDISFMYEPFSIYEDLKATKLRCDKVVDYYLQCTNLKTEHIGADFRTTVREGIKDKCGFVSGSPFQLIIDPRNIACEASGLTQGYFISVSSNSLAEDIKKYLTTSYPEAICFKCRKDSWYVLFTWPEYIPEGWKQEDYEYKLTRKPKTKTVKKKETEYSKAFLEDLFYNNKDVFMRLAGK